MAAVFVAPPQILPLEPHTPDARGPSFSVPALCLEHLGGIGDMHVASIAPTCVRGDHFHVERRELIIVLPHDRWSFHWDEGEGTAVHRRSFEDFSAMALVISPLCSHALRNDGDGEMWVVAATDGEYDPAAPDAYRRVVSAS